MSAPSTPTQGGSDQPQDQTPTQTRIRIRMPKDKTQEPIISRLTSEYGLTVNILAALLGPNSRDDGWFDLELLGPAHQIESALTYLEELKLEIWHNSDNANAW